MSITCPVCSAASPYLSAVDFNKCCEELNGKFLPLSRVPIQYHMCDQCGFAFAPEFQAWGERDFLEKIYNADYESVDPEYKKTRPEWNARLLCSMFGHARESIRHLDYGGGNGYLSEVLRRSGWNSISFDPFPSGCNDLKSLGKFDLITAFEVFEHVPDPNILMSNITELMKSTSLVLFSTLLNDGHLRRGMRIDWWYCSPRNGHISLYSLKSLLLLGSRYGLKCGSFDEVRHCFFNQVPDFAKQIIHSKG